jgi:hypothetical protein
LAVLVLLCYALIVVEVSRSLASVSSMDSTTPLVFLVHFQVLGKL